VGKGVTPEVLSFKNISFSPYSNQKEAVTQVINLYKKGPEKIQILTARNTVIDSINEQCQHQLNQMSEKLYVKLADTLFATSYKLNDPIIFIKNLWDLNIQNGKFGTIIEVSSKETLVASELNKDEVFGKIQMEDGAIIDINAKTIDHFRLSHCISVHKAQGSQFDEVIVLLDSSNIVDRDWIYTAITRATTKVHIIGSEKLFKQRVKATSNASKRETYIGELMLEREKQLIREV
jgi:exodeoxyribonuclease V alpha subunit